MHLKDELNPTVRRAQWVTQRIIWGLMAVVIALALVGLFGNGPLSEETVSAGTSAGALEVEYERFGRQNKPQRLSVAVSAPEGSGELSVTLSGEFTSHVKMRAVLPEPDSTSLSPDGPTYTWEVEDWAQPVVVQFEYAPLRWRSFSGDVTASDDGTFEETVKFTQWLFP